MKRHIPLSAEALEERMDLYLDAALSSRRTAVGPARELAAFPRDDQEFVLRWGRVIAKTNAELAYQFTAHASEALRCMDSEAVEAWLIHAMDLYDIKGQMPAIRAFQEVREFASNIREKLAGWAFEDAAGVLERFVCGLNGRPLKVAVGARTYTDTETLFLPPAMARLPDRDDNFRLYKAMAVHQWAQTWYGTWRGDTLFAALRTGRLPVADLPLLHGLERVRLDACIERELPGLHRDMVALRRQLDADDRGWEQAAAPLRDRSAGLEDSLELVERMRALPPCRCCYQGELLPESVAGVRELRLALDRNRFRIGLARLLEEHDGRLPGVDQEQAESLPETRERFHLSRGEDPDLPDGLRFQLEVDGKSASPPDDLASTMESIVQDLGKVPDDYLVAAGPGLYRHGAGAAGQDPDSVWSGTYHEEGAYLYDEWDHDRQHHRRAWCVLREHDIHPVAVAFWEHTLARYGGLIKSLRRTFEALRAEDRMLKKQAFGDDLDIDALVEAWADVHGGLEMSERLFTRMQRDERNIAVIFMVDMSGSTKGWVNEAEKESLILLSESLETLGDRYAIYGFSGWTRKRCEVYRIKAFDEGLDDGIRGRVCAVEPKDYTRMGAPIRHLTALFRQIDARIKLLITLSDGKPDDYDPQYRGTYGIEDTRMALAEARREGIHPFCITIDTTGQEYLPHMYGAANYIVIEDIASLPLKVSDIYRRLTS